MKVSSLLNKEFECDYGVIETVSPLIRRIVAPNPGPFTFKGTGTYIIGHKNVAVIDPGPLLKTHVDAILEELGDEYISHQLITHTHIDHSPASALIKEQCGSPTHGFGPHGVGSALEYPRVEEGGDKDFQPDILIADGDVIDGDGWTIECIHTPGHTSNHMCFALKEENSLFSGDHVMGWSTTVISPPDGDMGAYLESLRRLCSRDEKRYYPTHGSHIDNPQKFVKGLIAHRKMREGQVLSMIEGGQNSIKEIVNSIYKDLDVRLIGAARLSIFAHVLDLYEREKICCTGEISIDGIYYISP